MATSMRFGGYSTSPSTGTPGPRGPLPQVSGPMFGNTDITSNNHNRPPQDLGPAGPGSGGYMVERRATGVGAGAMAFPVPVLSLTDNGRKDKKSKKAKPWMIGSRNGGSPAVASSHSYFAWDKKSGTPKVVTRTELRTMNMPRGSPISASTNSPASSTSYVGPFTQYSSSPVDISVAPNHNERYAPPTFDRSDSPSFGRALSPALPPAPTRDFPHAERGPQFISSGRSGSPQLGRAGSPLVGRDPTLPSFSVPPNVRRYDTPPGSFGGRRRSVSLDTSQQLQQARLGDGEFRPVPPAKDVLYNNQARGRSLSPAPQVVRVDSAPTDLAPQRKIIPPPLAPSGKAGKTMIMNKKPPAQLEEPPKAEAVKRKIVFGLFPSSGPKEIPVPVGSIPSQTEFKQESVPKWGVAGLFQRKPEKQQNSPGGSPALSSRSAPTPPLSSSPSPSLQGHLSPLPWMLPRPGTPPQRFPFAAKEKFSPSSPNNTAQIDAPPRMPAAHARSNSNNSNISSSTNSRNGSPNLNNNHSRNPSSLSSSPWSLEQDAEVATATTAITTNNTTATEVRIPRRKDVALPPTPSTPGKRFRSRSRSRSRSTSRTRTRPAKAVRQDRHPKPSPLIPPPFSGDSYRKRNLPPAPISPPPLSPGTFEPLQPVAFEPLQPVAFKPELKTSSFQAESRPLSFEPLMPVAYSPSLVPSPLFSARLPPSPGTLSPGFEPLQAISMAPMTPHGLNERMSHRLSLSIPQVGRSVSQARFKLVLADGLGEFQVDSAVDAEHEEEEDDILGWLANLRFEAGEETSGRMMENGEDNMDTDGEAAQTPIQPLSPATPAPVIFEQQQAVIVKFTRVTPELKQDPQFPVEEKSGPNSIMSSNDLLSPPGVRSVANSPLTPTPSEFSFDARTSFASSVGDAFKYDHLTTIETIGEAENEDSDGHEGDMADWRDTVDIAATDCPNLLNDPTVAPPAPGLTPSSTFPTTTQASSRKQSISLETPSLSATVTFETFTLPSFSSFALNDGSSNNLRKSDINAIMAISVAASVHQETRDPYDVYTDGMAGSGLLTTEIEAILAAQQREEEEEKKRVELPGCIAGGELDGREVGEVPLMLEFGPDGETGMGNKGKRKTKYIRGRNSEFEGDILFVLRGKDM